ncbi:MAG TPA: hypothetical protein VGB05_05185 [Pyrinomonadaceae bacterium]
MNADGTGQVRLVSDTRVSPTLSWSPDGSKIAFSVYDSQGQSDIYTVNLADGAVTGLTTAATPGVDYRSPAWSPDGRQIALTRSTFTFIPGGDGEIYVMNADGSDLRNLTNSLYADGGANWSPDGSALVLTSLRDGNDEIYMMYPDGSGQVRLTNNEGQDFAPTWQLPQSNAPCLLAEAGTERAVALDSVTLMRDPFPVITAHNFSPDQRTRVTFFAKNVRLLPGDNASAVTTQAEDGRQNVYPLAVEHVGKVPGFNWLTQVTVKLPDELIGAGDVRVSISLHGATSNRGFIGITQGSNAP